MRSILCRDEVTWVVVFILSGFLILSGKVFSFLPPADALPELPRSRPCSCLRQWWLSRSDKGIMKLLFKFEIRIPGSRVWWLGMRSIIRKWERQLLKRIVIQSFGITELATLLYRSCNPFQKYIIANLRLRCAHNLLDWLSLRIPTRNDGHTTLKWYFFPSKYVDRCALKRVRLRLFNIKE